MIDYTNLETLHEAFPIPCESFETTGFQDGIVIRFKTFHLKIYDDERENAYIVYGYRYGENRPVFIYKVKWNDFKKFAAQFTQDNHLHFFGRMCHCEVVEKGCQNEHH